MSTKIVAVKVINISYKLTGSFNRVGFDSENGLTWNRGLTNYFPRFHWNENKLKRNDRNHSEVAISLNEN